MRVDGARARRRRRSPTPRASSSSRVNTRGRARGEVREQVELGGGEVHELAVELHAPRLEVDGDRAEAHGSRASARGPALDPAEQRVHPGDELARAERLGEVVVGADGQPDDEVGLGVAGGEHQHRHRAVALDLAAHLDAVEAGEHQVEDHEVGPERSAAARRPPGRRRRSRPRSPRCAAGWRPPRRSTPRPRPPGLFSAGWCGGGRAPVRTCVFQRKEPVGGCRAGAVEIRCRSTLTAFCHMPVTGTLRTGNGDVRAQRVRYPHDTPRRRVRSRARRPRPPHRDPIARSRLPPSPPRRVPRARRGCGGHLHPRAGPGRPRTGSGSAW